MELWQSILLGLGGNVGVLLLVAYLGRSLFGQLLTKDIEEFKNKLQANSDIAIERLKADLQRTTVEHEVRFARLHEKRADVLAELYKLLVVATWETESFASPIEWTGEPDKKEKYGRAMNAITEYFRFFDQHRIYLPPKLCESLEGFAKILRKPTIMFGVYLKYDHPNDKTAEEKQKAWDAAWHSAENDVPIIRLALETEFRKLLGVVPLQAQ